MFIDGLVELHSVWVVMDKCEFPSNQVYGELKAIDGAMHQLYFFKEQKESARSLSEDDTLPLVSPSRCVMGPDFKFIIYLKEKISDREVCRGHFTRYYYAPGGKFNEPLKMVCRGEHGYAVLHMRLISTAVQGTVNVSLVINKDIGGHLPTIHGKLVARYREEEFKNDYARKYFQTLLFSVPEDQPEELLEAGEHEGPERSKQFKISLSRSVIAVLRSDEVYQEWLLVIKADVGINFPGTKLEASKVKGIFTLDAEGDKPEPSIERIDLEHNYGYIEVKVSWNTNISKEAFSVPPDFDLSSLLSSA